MTPAAPAAHGDSPGVYRLADLRLDAGRQRLTRDGREIPLPRLSYNLLVALVQAAPNVVSVQQLMDAVWPGVVVNPETVAQRVKLLRDALDDDPRAPRYVSVLRGRGYQLACPVFVEADDESGAPLAAGAPAEPRDGPLPDPVGTARTTRLWAALVLMAFVVALAAWWSQREPVPVRPSADAASGQEPSESGRVATVAVLPFRDLSADGSAEYIALGVPEQILDRLSIVQGLTVIAWNSSSDAAASGPDAAAIARSLRAGYLVEGSVQRQGDALRITARLVDPQSAEQLWSETYDRGVADLFEVQSRIADEVAGALRQRVEGVAALPDRPLMTSSIEAYLLFLQGRVRLGRWTVVDAEEAARLFERAVALDPSFAAAWASLYDAKMMAVDRRRGDLGVARRENRQFVERALSIDPRSGAAYFARAIWAASNDATVEEDFRRGAELDPSNGRGLVAYSQFLFQRGEKQEARRWLDRAAKVDPLSPRVQFRLVMQNFGEMSPQEIEALLLRVLEREPDFHPALQRYAKYRWILHGRMAESTQAIEHAIAVDPENPWSRYTAAAIYLDLGEEGAAREVAAGTPESAEGSRVLLALYDGDLAAAWQAVASGATRANNLHENWGEAEAVRDHALASGDLHGGIDYLESRFRLDGAARLESRERRVDLDGVAPLEIRNFRAAAYVAQLARAAGDERRAAELLDRLEPAIEASVPVYGTVYALRTLATVRALRGDTDSALATLAESFRTGDLTQWWYTFERDPVWKPFASDPRFQAIALEVRRQVDSERRALETLRSSGAVPRRGAEMRAPASTS
jgi:TolB-like protein/DNA-binding winged helix-turn-helix (wHTH) protein/Tfp pilus assembly protein PilF